MKSKLAPFIFFQVVFFFRFEYFSIFAIAVILLNKIFKKNYFMNYNSNFFKLVTSIFYFGKLLFATNINFLKFWKSTSYSLVSIDNPFIDMQQFLFKVKCNALKENFMYDPVYRTETSWFPSVECENYLLAYGPIENLISFNFQNIWSSTLVVAFIFTTILIKIYFDLIDAATEKYKYIMFFLSLSPAVNFLIDRANIDLIIYICIYYIFKNYQNYMVPKLLLLLFFSLLKLHPIFIIFGLLIYFVITKEYKIASLHFKKVLAARCACTIFHRNRLTAYANLDLDVSTTNSRIIFAHLARCQHLMPSLNRPRCRLKILMQLFMASIKYLFRVYFHQI